MTKTEKIRCEWVGNDPLYIAYHDTEWGVPVHDDTKLFELLILEGAQAGLSWSTILKKRENYRRAFDGFSFQVVAKYDEGKARKLHSDAGIVRNKLKIAAAIQNAKSILAIIKEFGSFDAFIWQFVDGTPLKSTFYSLSDYPAKTKESEQMSKALLARGFRFVGPTICYAFMQATGMVNDHQTQCFRYDEVK